MEKHAFFMCGTIKLRLYHACSYTVGPKKGINQVPLFEDIQTIFFRLSVSDRLLHTKYKKKVNLKNVVHGEHFRAQFLYGHIRRMD